MDYEITIKETKEKYIEYSSYGSFVLREIPEYTLFSQARIDKKRKEIYLSDENIKNFYSVLKNKKFDYNLYRKYCSRRRGTGRYIFPSYKVLKKIDNDTIAFWEKIIRSKGRITIKMLKPVYDYVQFQI
jgi:hypothetical protein